VKVRDAMSRQPVTVGEHTSVQDALRLLADRLITMLPVVDSRGRILGIVSEIDLLEEGLSLDRSADGAAREALPRIVADVMSHTTVLAHPETELVELGPVLATTAVKSLPVVDAADQVVGVISRSDIVRMLTRGAL
jgi:CBS-domain-containing membrane protein